MSVDTVTMLLHASAGWLACSHLWHVVAEEADRHAARGGATDGDVEKNLRDAMTLLVACSGFYSGGARRLLPAVK